MDDILFLCFLNLAGFAWIGEDLYAFSRVFNGFQEARGMDFWGLAKPSTTLEIRPAALIETFPRIQAGFLASQVFQHIS